MLEMFVYHVVTDRPMKLHQRIVFDENNRSGVYTRVMAKLDLVKAIYQTPSDYPTLDYPTQVALRELALEEVRLKEFPNYPSRLGALYVSRTEEEAHRWAEYFISLGRPTYSLVKLKISGSLFEGDALNCFDGSPDHEENLRLARRYWENQPNDENSPPIVELLAGGEIEVVEIIREYNANIGH